jgi:hypothetical protein
LSVTKGTIIDPKYVIFLYKMRSRNHAVLKVIRPLSSTAVAWTLIANAAFREVFGFLCGGMPEDHAM